MEKMLTESFIIFVLIVLLTVFQKYHFKMLYYLSYKYHSIFRVSIKTIIRLWIIIHEISHLFFWILSWAKIHKIELFREDWWRVIFSAKNYIWHLWEYWWRPWYITKLFFNQIWIFLTSIWPLIIWMFLTFAFIYYFTIPLGLYELNDYLLNFNTDIKMYVITLFYIIIIPSFLLSFQDIKNFIISKQDTVWATIVWSIINSTIFLWFLWFLTFFYSYFIVFSIFYFLWFCVLFLFWLINYVFYLIID